MHDDDRVEAISRVNQVLDRFAEQPDEALVVLAGVIESRHLDVMDLVPNDDDGDEDEDEDDTDEEDADDDDL